MCNNINKKIYGKNIIIIDLTYFVMVMCLFISIVNTGKIFFYERRY